ncbi:hypothetical protein OQA88_11175 [Cercophora sp. LCS_1]
MDTEMSYFLALAMKFSAHLPSTKGEKRAATSELPGSPTKKFKTEFVDPEGEKAPAFAFQFPTNASQGSAPGVPHGPFLGSPGTTTTMEIDSGPMVSNTRWTRLPGPGEGPFTLPKRSRGSSGGRRVAYQFDEMVF